MSFILEDVGLAWKGPNYVNCPEVLPPRTSSRSTGSTSTWDKLIVLLITVPVLALLVWLVQERARARRCARPPRTWTRRAMMGINVNRTISFTFLIAGGLAGAAGFLYAIYVTTSASTRASSSV